MLSSSTLERADALRQQFQSAQPFKHIAIDNFFETDAAERLLTEFPAFDPKLAIAENGSVGRKAVRTNISSISPFYSQVFDYITSRAFLDAISRITGIPDLEPDLSLFGAGTHENLHGQDLMPHIDFNMDNSTGRHRRLNILLYLNKDWQEKWGGAIEIHSNPRRPQENSVKAVNVLFNRAMLFETNEVSWHGFRLIDLPDDKRHLSRKALSIYLYTRERPAHEIAPSHGTFYWPWPLPKTYLPGDQLEAGDAKAITGGVLLRDHLLEGYQQLELKLQGQIQALEGYMAQMKAALHPPVLGYATPYGPSSGYLHDGWAEAVMTTSLAPARPVGGISLQGWLPDFVTTPRQVTLTVEGLPSVSAEIQPGSWSLFLPLARPITAPFHLTVSVDQTFSGKRSGVNGDERELGFRVVGIVLDH